ncbi:MAG: hypothetical protein HW380_2490 [Magnetococcales bacterium]|nr:hypothetical protein [Magnetococcales bacterium]
MKYYLSFPILLSVLTLGIETAVSDEKGRLEEEIFKTITPSEEEKIGPWSLVDVVKLALENDNNVEVIMAKGMREVAAGEYQEKRGAFNLTASLGMDNSQEIMPTPGWVHRDLVDLKREEAALPGGSAPALVKALEKQATLAEQGTGTFKGTDMKSLSDVKSMASGLNQLNDASIEKNTHKTTGTFALKQKFRMGAFAKLETILDRTDPVNHNAVASNNAGATNIGITQFNVRIPLLRNSGTDAYLWTVEEKEKKLEYEAKQKSYRHEVANRVREIAKAYWDYKAAMEKADILRVSERLVSKWAENSKQKLLNQGNVAVKKAGKGDGKKAGTGSNDEVNTLSARLAGEARDLEEGLAAVYAAKTALAQLVGIGVEELTAKGYPADEFPTDLSVNLKDDALKKRLFELAQTQRADLRAALLVEEKAGVQLKKAKNDLLPDLVVDMTVGAMGGDVDGSGLDNSMNGFTDNLVYPLWKVGVTLEYPFGNDAAKGMLSQRNMAQMRDSMLVAETERTVRMGVKKSLNALQHQLPSVALSREEIKNYWPSVEGSLEKYDGNKGSASLSTLMDLLTLEEKLKQALIKNVTAKSDLAKGIVDLRFATGTILPNSEIEKDDEKFSVSKNILVTVP